MKLRLKVGRAGATFVQNRGDVIEVPDEEAARMIAADQAEPFEGEPREPVVERAVAKPRGVEKAAK